MHEDDFCVSGFDSCITLFVSIAIFLKCLRSPVENLKIDCTWLDLCGLNLHGFGMHRKWLCLPL